MKKVVIISGPAAAGKDTTAKLLGEQVERSALISVDDLREFVVNGYAPPWDKKDGKEQLILGATNAIGMAQNFMARGFIPIITDVLGVEITAIYEKAFPESDRLIVTLLPTLEECLARNKSRGDGFPESRLKYLHELLSRDRAGEVIDNTNLSPEATAECIKALMAQS